MIGVDIREAAAYLRQGELVAIPTETVYGLAANGLNEEAVAKVFRVKNRPFFDPLILHTDSMEKMKELTSIVPPTAEHLGKHFWPGPLTILLPKSNMVSDLVTAGSSLVALRIPSHPMTLELLKMLDFPLAAPSANPFTYISPTRAEHVEAQLGSKIKMILNGGECKVGIESTIVEPLDHVLKVHRLGGISMEELEKASGMNVQFHTEGQQKIQSPGQFEKHYSPKTRVILSSHPYETVHMHKNEKIGVLNFGSNMIQEDVFSLNLSHTGDTVEAARNLFHYMRLLDAQEFDLIVACKLPENELGPAINDRLKRASYKSL